MLMDNSSQAKSKTEARNSENVRFITGDFSKTEFLYPLYDSIATHVKYPSIISSITCIYFYLQSAMTAFWFSNPYYRHETGNLPEFARYFFLIFFWFDPYDADRYLTIGICIVCSLTAITLFYLVFELRYFYSKRSFMNWSLYIGEFLNETVSLLLIQPCALLTGYSFIKIYYESGSEYWAIFVFSIICLLINFAISYFNISLSGASCILHTSTFQTFDPSGTFLFLSLNAIFLFCGYIFHIFPNWSYCILQVVHVFCFLYLFSYTFTFSNYTAWKNVLFGAFTVTECVSDVICIITNFTYSIPYLVIPIAFAICLVAAIIILFFVQRSIINRTAKKLNYPEENLSDDKKMEFFDDLDLLNDEKKMVKYLRIGMFMMCDSFIDCSLHTYLFRNYVGDSAMTSIIQLISFFPTEVKLTSQIFRKLISSRTLSFSEKFVVYQVSRIRTFRASGQSNESNERIIQLRSLNSKCESYLRSFWTMPNPDFSYCESLRAEISKVKTQMEDSLGNFPNNSKVSLEYSRFLCETETDLEESILKFYRAELIDNGSNFAIDHCFRSFAKMFPDYLVKEKLDITGRRIIKKDKEGGSRSSSYNSSRNTDLSSTLTLDAEQEETFGKKLFRQSRMRLTLNNSIRGRKIPMRTVFIILSIIVALIPIATCLIIYFLLIIDVDDRNNTSHFINYASDVYYSISSVISGVFLRWAKLNNVLQNLDTISGFENDKGLTYVIDPTGDLAKQAMEAVAVATENLDSLLSKMVERAEGGEKIYPIGSTLFNQSLVTVYCLNSQLAGGLPSTFKDKFLYTLYMASVVDGLDDNNYKDVFANNDLCEAGLNGFSLINDTVDLLSVFMSTQIKESEDVADVSFIIALACPLFNFAFIFIPIAIVCFLHIHNMNKNIRVLANLEPSVKEDAKKPIMNQEEQEEENNISSQVPTKCHSAYYLILFYLFYIIVVVVIISLLTNNVKALNANLKVHNSWLYEAGGRAAATSISTIQLLCAIALDPDVGPKPTWVNRDRMLLLSTINLNRATTLNKYLLEGDGDHKSIYGETDAIDNIQVKERCDATETDASMHDVYSCSSAVQQFSIFNSLAEQVMNEMAYYGGKISQTNPLNLMHLSFAHLVGGFKEIKDLIMDMVNAEMEDIYTQITIDTTILCLMSVLSVLVMLKFVAVENEAYKVLLSLIKHMTPAHIISSKEVMDFLMNRNVKEDDKPMGIAQSVIYNAADAILCVGLNGIIEVVNPAVSSILGYTPDQVLGQQITGFIAPQSSEQISKQLELMANGQSGSVYDTHISCVSDSAIEIQFHATIIGMKSEGSRDISSFVFILTDETELLRQQAEAEIAKAKSEKLLYQILPKDIVFRLNRGEKDISFSIPHATIIFIDIVKFSDYSASLTPQEIMGNLSTVFAAFDNCVSKYPRITKIKLIGDVYMAAAGLFGSPDDPPNGHAEDMVKFAVDCLEEMESINIKINASLEVRIGVNTGGPLIAGVLGTDKPAFDIIGDPINVASRLQSTDIPGKIQVSSATKELIENLGYPIEERGEVYLKGKGNQKTYLILPPTNFMAQLTSSLVH